MGREGGRVGVGECGEQKEGGGGSVISEVKHVVAVVGGAPDLKRSRRTILPSTFTLSSVRIRRAAAGAGRGGQRPA